MSATSTAKAGSTEVASMPDDVVAPTAKQPTATTIAGDSAIPLAKPESLGEIAQAKIRFGMNIAFIFLGLVAYQHDPSIGLGWVWATFSVCAVSALSLYLWAAMLGKSLKHPRWRVGQRIASIVADNIAVTWLLYFGGQALAGAYGVYLWITIGYGMRFGLPYLYGNLAASLTGYFIVTQASDFWRTNASLSIGLGIALFVVPVYAAFLIRRLHSAVAEARRAYAAKSNFVATMSHELRTPLHGIIAVADLLGRTQATDRQREMFRIVSVSSHTLLDLINRILDISKFEDGTFAIQREPMNLHAVVTDTLTILWPQARAKGLELEFFVDSRIAPEVLGPPRQLQEVLINLAGNAVKFTETGRVCVTVMADTAPPGQVGVHFAITDTGPGLSREQLDKIFNPFYQADASVTRKHGGTGLGTAIAKELVRLMGGTVSVESEVGRGTTFTVGLSFELLRAAGATASPPPQDICLLAGEQSAPDIEEALRTFGVHGVRRFAPNVHRLPTMTQAPAAIIVDLSSVEELPGEIRSRVCGHLHDTYVPVFAVGPSERESAARLTGFNSYADRSELQQGIRAFLGLAQALREEYASQVGQNDSGARIRVLVAEDNMTNQAIARMALADAGFESTFVADGEGALAELSEGEHDIALLDMHMPIMDGMEVARLYNFSVQGAKQRIPIVMVTADSRPEIVAEAEEAGISAFLTKPLKPSVMIETINAIVRGQNATAQPPARQFPIPEPQVVPSTHVVDEKVVLDLLGYMDELDRETFFAEFVEDAYMYISSLDRLDDDAAIEKVRNDMHALCGAARTVGAESLAALARKLEFTTGEEIRGNVQRIQEDLRDLVQESSQELRRLAGLSPPAETDSPLSAINAGDRA